MPRYDIRCRHCSCLFEASLPFGGILPPCPACGSKEVIKEISVPGVIFKGEGFYKTAGRNTKPETPTPPAQEEASAQKKEEKPAKKTGKDGCGGCLGCGHGGHT